MFAPDSALFFTPVAEILEWMGPEKTLVVFGIKMVGLNGDNLKRRDCPWRPWV